MGNYSFFIYIGCIVAIIIVGRFLILPLRKIIKLIINSLLGALLLYIINMVGAQWGFHIGLNWGTLACTGLLGIPGVVLLVVLKCII